MISLGSASGVFTDAVVLCPEGLVPDVVLCPEGPFPDLVLCPGGLFPLPAALLLLLLWALMALGLGFEG